MISVKEFWALLIVFICLIIIIFISCFYPPNTIITNFATRLPIANGILIGVGIFITYMIFQVSVARSNIDITILTQEKGFVDIMKLCKENYKECPQFINSLNYDFKGTNIDYTDIHTNNESLQTKQYIAFAIFQSIENYFCTWNITESSDSEWFCTYFIWMSSKPLQEMWYDYGLPFYGIKTKAYVDYLIDANKKNKFKNNTEIIKFSEKIIKMKEFHDMVFTEDNTNLKYILT
jgi:hypothetical protein